jgi:TolB-like protein
MPEERVLRRLAAILATDVAGYSRLMGVDEEGTHERLKAHFGEVIDPKIREHRGRTVKNTGDGLLAEFGSVVDAVRCAVEIQREMLERERDVPDERRIIFRIGINLGDIIVEEHDIFGDGVNVAARLEALAEPGGICISQVVRDQVRDKIDAAFEDMGEQQVKNIARPVHVWRIQFNTKPTEPTPALALPNKPSIAILPFQNLSGDPDLEYFADGMVEEIITALSRISWLFVIARNSSFIYKGQAVDVKRVGRELGVRYVLEGSVRKAAGRVRITAQLIAAETGAHLWADHFDGSLKDVFELQDQVATSVAGAIGSALQAIEGRRQREGGQRYRQREAEQAARPAPAERPEHRSAAAEALPSGSAATDAAVMTPHRLTSAEEPPVSRTAPAEALTAELGAVDKVVLTRLQRCLARYVGPIAKVLIDSAARKAQSIGELCELLAGELASPEERRDFLREALRECSAYAVAGETQRPPAAAGGPTLLGGADSAPLQSAVPLATVELALAEMTRIVGPFARVLVKSLLPSCTTAAEFWARLAEHIEQPAERAAFMRRQPR